MKSFIVFLLISLSFIVTISTETSKIDEQLLTDISLRQRANFYIHMKETVNIEKITDNKGTLFNNIKDYDIRANLIFNHLTHLAEVTQKPIIQLLKKNHLKFDSLWITNSLFVYNGDLQLIKQLAKRNDVEKIVADYGITDELPEPLQQEINNVQPEWHVKWSNADKVWEKGHKGEGVVLSVADTGVQYTHEALVENYRGNKGDGQFEHNYNWYDPSRNTKEPNDYHGHGTHCMSIAAGGNKGREVGLAPGAKWVGCKALGGSSSGIIKCIQWLMAPTDLQGNNPKPNLRPHVSSHSYFCRGCRAHEAIKALVAAGVMFIKSAGNAGSRCSSITEPGFYKEVIAIGALQKQSDDIARFSSRGPTNDGLTKPDFSAPGSSIVAAFKGSNTNYRSLSGTSMAAPNFNGCVGLLWSAVPELKREIEKTREVFQATSKGQETNACSSNGSPNNVFGYGTIDCAKAVEYAKRIYSKN